MTQDDHVASKSLMPYFSLLILEFCKKYLCYCHLDNQFSYGVSLVYFSTFLLSRNIPMFKTVPYVDCKIYPYIPILTEFNVMGTYSAMVDLPDLSLKDLTSNFPNILTVNPLSTCRAQGNRKIGIPPISS